MGVGGGVRRGLVSNKGSRGTLLNTTQVRHQLGFTVSRPLEKAHFLCFKASTTNSIVSCAIESRLQTRDRG